MCNNYKDNAHELYFRYKIWLSLFNNFERKLMACNEISFLENYKYQSFFYINKSNCIPQGLIYY